MDVNKLTFVRKNQWGVNESTWGKKWGTMNFEKKEVARFTKNLTTAYNFKKTGYANQSVARFFDSPLAIRLTQQHPTHYHYRKSSMGYGVIFSEWFPPESSAASNTEFCRPIKEKTILRGDPENTYETEAYERLVQQRAHEADPLGGLNTALFEN